MNIYATPVFVMAIASIGGVPVAASAQQIPTTDSAQSPAAGGGVAAPQARDDGRSSAKGVRRTAKGAGRNRDRAAAGAESDDGTIVITGSRLKEGDPTSRVTVITAEDITARGVTSVEELVRTLPQNLATIGGITNERTNGPLTNRRAASVSQLGSLGVSAANLGGSGAGNTLVLVNGRRLAGAAGIEDGFVNLNNIPLAAIDRVEIDTNGVSAVYGADAIGGVINFILKSNYTGTTISAQHEFSRNDADNSRVSIASGAAWGSGSVSGTLGFSRRLPINNHKSGYTTENYASYFGGNPLYDYRSFGGRGLQPGVISIPSYAFDPASGNLIYSEGGLSVPGGSAGRPRIEDFVTLDPNSKRDYVAELAGPRSDTINATLNVEQKLTDRLKFFANGLYTRTKNKQQSDYHNGLRLQLAPGQYYNPFPARYFDEFVIPTNVSYFPADELASGLLPPATVSNTSSQWSINAGLTYNLNSDTKIELVYSTSRSRASARSMTLGSIVQLQTDETSPTGVSCYNFDLATNHYTGANLADFRRTFERQCAALTSSDPAIAFNPWKSGANGTGSGIGNFLYLDQAEQRTSRLQNFEARMNGTLLTLPAGKVFYAIGAEYQDDGVNSREVNNFTGQAASRDRYAFFGEMNLPLVGGSWHLPLVRELLVNLAVRNDTYLTDGAIGTEGGIPIDQGGKILFGHNRFSRSTPAIGVRWVPIDGLSVRGKWTQGFRAPPYTQLFSVNGSSVTPSYIINDPLYSCTTDCAFSYPGITAYAVPLRTAPNPNLKPQTSMQQNYAVSWNPAGVLEGLSVDVTYNRTVIHNEYGRRDDLYAVLPAADQLRIAQFYPRDANGKIIATQNLVFNLGDSLYSSITYEVGYRIPTRFGNFRPGVIYLDNLKAQRTIIAGTAPISTLGRVQGPDDYRIVGTLAWSLGNLDATLWAYHTPSYVNDYIAQLSAGVIQDTSVIIPVRSMTTIDLTASWRLSNGLRFNFAGRNVLNAKPPFVVVDQRPYDTARYNAAGRTLSFEVQYSF